MSTTPPVPFQIQLNEIRSAAKGSVFAEGDWKLLISLALSCQSGKLAHVSLSAAVPWTKTTRGRTIVSDATVTGCGALKLVMTRLTERLAS